MVDQEIGNDDMKMEENEIKALAHIEQGAEEEEKSAEDKIELEDIGKGLMLLGGIILLCYFFLLLVSVMVEVDPGRGIWTMPGFMASTVIISVVLMIVGFVIRSVTRENETA